MSAITFIACALVLMVSFFLRATRLYFLVLNVVSFGIIALDKFKSSNQLYRTRETDFYVLFLFGGWIGGLLGMMALRHKTRKASFLISVAVASALNIIVISRVFGWI